MIVNKKDFLIKILLKFSPKLLIKLNNSIKSFLIITNKLFVDSIFFYIMQIYL